MNTKKMNTVMKTKKTKTVMNTNKMKTVMNTKKMKTAMKTKKMKSVLLLLDRQPFRANDLYLPVTCALQARFKLHKDPTSAIRKYNLCSLLQN